MLYKVTVFLNSDYIEVKDDKIEIGVVSRPQKGKANSEIIRKIAKHFGVSSSSVRLVLGEKSRDRIIKVTRN
ncbi:MAG: DUF167 domain-containing protein [Thaumarchaeota archaeon]|nr:DUF167 domain-containing protein [Nitrososphaerota archaeon]